MVTKVEHAPYYEVVKDTYKAKTIEKEKRGDLCCSKNIAWDVWEVVEPKSLVNVQFVEEKEGLMATESSKTILGIVGKISHYGNFQIKHIHVIWEFPF